jgi:hypothetical protein
MLSDLVNFDAILWVYCEYFSDQIFQWLRKTDCDIVLAIHNFLVQLHYILAILKRQIPASHGKENNSCRPDIDSQSFVDLIFEHLWCSIAGRPTGGLESLVLLVSVGKPEVHNPQVHLIVEQEVLRLEVAMDHSDAMDVFDAIDELMEDAAGFLLFESLVISDIVEKLPVFHVLHDQKQFLWGFDYLV